MATAAAAAAERRHVQRQKSSTINWRGKPLRSYTLLLGVGYFDCGRLFACCALPAVGDLLLGNTAAARSSSSAPNSGSILASSHEREAASA
jgi:hypothetical protein